MYLIDTILRVSSIIVLVLVVHQLFLSKGGSKRHNLLGTAAMVCGIVLMIVVVARGVQQESFSMLYAVHLLVGTLFFVSLFTTGFLGYREKRKKALPHLHQRMGKITLLLLMMTLVVGIISSISH